MKLPEEGMLLRIFIGESDKHNGKPLYEQIVVKAKELHLAGATAELGNKIELVGDDLFCTNPRILAQGIEPGVANSILI
jgi:hypothetical protein